MSFKIDIIALRREFYIEREFYINKMRQQRIVLNGGARTILFGGVSIQNFDISTISILLTNLPTIFDRFTNKSLFCFRTIQQILSNELNSRSKMFYPWRSEKIRKYFDLLQF